MGSPHVLLVPSWYPTAEDPVAGVFFREQALALRRSGARVGVVYPEFRSLRTASLAGVRRNHFQISVAHEDGIPVCRAHGWNVVPRLVVGGMLWTHVAARLVAQYEREFGPPELLHGHAALWGGVAAGKIAAARGIPYVVTEHFSGYTEHFTGFAPGKVSPGQLGAARGAYGGAARVIAVSSALGGALVDHGLAPAARLEVVPNIVDTDFFTLPPPGVRGDGGAFRFLAVGTLERIKGQEVLLHAFARAFGESGDVELDIVGDGCDRQKLRELAARLGLGSRVRFLGPAGRTEVRDAMWRADVLVHASHIETFGVVLIEALATGLPVVATACGGPGDIVTPEVGELVPPGDAAALAAALTRARSRGTPRAPEAIRRHAVERFSAPRVAGRLLDLYAGVLDGALPAAPVGGSAGAG
jgi:glycosyltransferase involved in cell wall biosynthesis